MSTIASVPTLTTPKTAPPAHPANAPVPRVGFSQVLLDGNDGRTLDIVGGIVAADQGAYQAMIKERQAEALRRWEGEFDQAEAPTDADADVVRREAVVEEYEEQLAKLAEVAAAIQLDIDGRAENGDLAPDAYTRLKAVADEQKVVKHALQVATDRLGPARERAAAARMDRCLAVYQRSRADLPAATAQSKAYLEDVFGRAVVPHLIDVHIQKTINDKLLDRLKQLTPKNGGATCPRP
jgi:hypothetical protein